MGVISIVDRAVLAAYCQAYGRWVEAEGKFKEAPLNFKTPSGYVQQSPWLGIANWQMERMGRYMARPLDIDAAICRGPLRNNVRNGGGGNVSPIGQRAHGRVTRVLSEILA